MTWIDYAIVIGFISGMAMAGLWISRLIKDSDDFFVAGRELTPFILCATITSTNVSMFHFIGMGGTAYKSGASILWQNWTGDIALVVSGVLVVPLLRRLAVRSVPEFLEMRYSRGFRMLVGGFWGLRLSTYLGMLLYVASTAAIIITGSAPTKLNYVLWMFAFAAVSVLYSVVGGAWAVAIMDSVQFVIMLAGGMVILAAAAWASGGMPHVFARLSEMGEGGHLDLVPLHGDFNWLFIVSIMLLGFKFASVDQAILQRAFGGQTPRAGAQGMVLSALVTTPLALFWVLPGMAAQTLHPGFENPDHAMPWLLAHSVPSLGRGMLGFVLCGLLAAQVSVITADVNSVATLLTSDVYRSLRKTPPTQRELLYVVRVSSLLCGALMLIVAYLLKDVGAGAVKVNLSVVGIIDMPLFIVTIVYGLLWRRANWQGAVAGFLLGGLVGVSAYLAAPGLGVNVQTIRLLVPIISSTTALIVTPIVSLLTAPGGKELEVIWANLKAVGEDDFHIVPKSGAGKVGLAMVLAGVAVFFAGVLGRPLGLGPAVPVAVGGMLTVFAGGVIRVYSR